MESIFFILTLNVLISWGASESEPMNYLFESVDANEDGKIDRGEFSEDMKKYAFKNLDNNHNNAVSIKEWGSLKNITIREEHEKLFKTIDIDKDKKITFFEFSDYAEGHSNIEKAFMVLDRNKDGMLLQDEITVRTLFRMITIYFH